MATTEDYDLDPDAGHAFTISVSSRGSYGVSGEEHHQWMSWDSEPSTVTVQAWNLPDALRKAADLPLAAWFLGDDDEAIRPGQRPAGFTPVPTEEVRDGDTG